MKRPDDFLTNTTSPSDRPQGQASNDPGGSTGTGVDAEIYNDPAYAVIATAETWREGGISGSNEDIDNSDLRDAIEEMNGKRVSGVAEWDASTTYSSPGTETDLVMYKGFQFINISDVNNLGNIPFDNPKLWLKIPKVDDLMDLAMEGRPTIGGFSPVSDRQASQYLQNFLYGRYRLGGNGDDFYDFYRVQLDGTQITGDGTLESIFDIGGGEEYPFLDMWTTESGGNYTLDDIGEYIPTPQSSSGENDTMGELLQDRFQGHSVRINGQDPGIAGSVTSASALVQAGQNANSSTTDGNDVIGKNSIIADDVNGSPRTGLTTRPKEKTTGVLSIIVMKKVTP